MNRRKSMALLTILSLGFRIDRIFYPIDISRFLNRLMSSPWRNTGRGEIPDPSRLEKSERAMKTEKALARLASNHLDDAALAELYRNDKVKIDGIITQWFGKGTIATDA